MPCIVPIIEGDGEMDAVPLLLRRILHQRQLWHWSVSRPIQAQNLSKLKKKLENFLAYAQARDGCRGILILLDMDDGCPAEEADILAGRVRKFHLRCPVAIVFAYREYEAWFLPGPPEMARPHGLSGKEFIIMSKRRRKIPDEIRRRVADLADHRCNYCRSPEIVGLRCLLIILSLWSAEAVRILIISV